MHIMEIYDRLANGYDRSHFHPDSAATYAEERRYNLICPHLKRAKNLKVLDIAYGTGTYLEIAKRYVANVVGHDISENMVRIRMS
jgi:ubiquinone/menaquinone biosynthesis C-methylase UbiE